MMLATVDELASYMQQKLLPDVAASAELALTIASDLVESHCRRSFAMVIDDELVMRWRPTIVLPSPPLVEISSVEVDGVATTYNIDESGRLWLNRSGDEVRIVYSHGFATVPGIVKGIVLRAATRFLANPQMQSSYNGPEGLTFSSDSGPRLLTGDEASALSRFVLHRMI